MADEEKLIADAFHQAFKKNAKVPTELYMKMHHELTIDDKEPLKVNLTMKRGLVLDIEDDSMFRTFLSIGDIVLTINDKVASRPDFKLTDVFKDKAGKMISFTYIRLRNYSSEEPPLEDGERRDNCEYKVAVIYSLQRMNLGIAMEGLNNRVYITNIQPKSLGSLCAAVGDVILHVNGKRVTDTEKVMSLILDELESKSHFKITLERAKTEEARAQVAFAISKDNRDPPIPADCAAYTEKAMAAMKGPEPKSILRAPRLSLTDEQSKVGFHDRITSENVIPSDVADDALIKTPARVPSAPGAAGTQQQQYLPLTSIQPTSEDRTEVSVTKGLSVKEAEAKKGVSKEGVKSTNRKGKGSKKTHEGKSKESRHKLSSLSTEIFFGRNRKKSAGSGGTAEALKKKKKNKKDHTHTNTASADTEGNQ